MSLLRRGGPQLRSALGLRSRFVGAILLTSAVTLAAAAVALLSPLERRLREDELISLNSNLPLARSAFGKLKPADARPDSPVLRHTAYAVGRRTEARMIVLDGAGTPLFNPSNDTVLTSVARSALRTRRGVRWIGSDGGTLIAAVATRARVAGRPGVVALRRSLVETRIATGVVSHAFAVSSVIGLAVGLVLGIWLVSALLRRLRRLRDAVLRVGAHGLEAEIPSESNNDEVADLTRAFQSMQAALRRQEEARKAFIATASHELRTPITSLNGMLELLDDDLSRAAPDLSDARLQLSGARRQSDRLVALARNLLDLSRLDAGTALRHEPVELVEVCRAVLAEFEMRAHEQRVSLTIDPQPGGVWALADPGSVARIVRILVDNALRYSPEGEAIVMKVERTELRVTLTVSDSGPGVPAADADSVFERFSRGANAGPDDGGFGLGLAIGRELARQMEGDLGLIAHDGRGARFALWLPPAPDLHGTAQTVEPVVVREAR
ncbi:MAG: hypothetical protein NVSMB25_09390 [Thermoleophilaceae bacterium]